MHAYRSHTCADLNTNHVGQTIRLSGWVHRVRDHGGVLFIDLRDHYGITQVLADSDSPAFAALEKVRAEWVIRIMSPIWKCLARQRNCPCLFLAIRTTRRKPASPIVSSTCAVTACIRT